MNYKYLADITLVKEDDIHLRAHKIILSTVSSMCTMCIVTFTALPWV